MFKLTLILGNDKTEYAFDQDEIIIGNADSKIAHIKIAGKEIEDRHVKIVQENERFLVYNTANDPFTALNGQPFGKKTLKNHDVIQIKDYSIAFESAPKEQPVETPLPPPPVQEEPLEAFDFEAILKEVEAMEKPVIPADTSPAEEDRSKKDTVAAQHPATIDLGDSPPPIKQSNEQEVELPDPSSENKHYAEAEEDAPEEQDGALTGNWKMLSWVLFAIIALSTIVCSGVYFRASGKNSQEEKKIAAGIADISMAMIHAQFTGMFPNHQNWSDPEFISTNLECVLSPNLHTQAQIDNEGAFIRYPYILRVYTSGDLSRFLIIAQPAPNFLQWLIHKKAIVVDSATMEMRKISDLKKLNRLLANPNPLEGNNGAEISRVLNEGSLMSLSSLAGNKNRWGFIPPKALGYIRPGAENYIYNAPRYYPFGESILSRAIALNQHDISSSEVATFQEEMKKITEYTDIVLYTSQGLQSAIEAQKTLAVYLHSNNYIVGYVKFNNRGFVSSSHIFMNDDLQDVAYVESKMLQAHSLLETSELAESEGNDEVVNFPDALHMEESDNDFDSFITELPSVDTNHPLYLRLIAISSARRRGLTPLGNEITELVRQQNLEILPNFNESVSLLLEKYIELDAQHRTRIVQELALLYQEYSEMPLEEFMSFIEASKLTSFINEALKFQRNQLAGMESLEEAVKHNISSVATIETFSDLDDAVQHTADMLNLERFPDPEKLISYQEALHNTVLERLSLFLLSSKSPYKKAKLKEEDRTTLIRILKTSWVTDPDEFSFFVAEFDYLKNVNTH